MSSGPISERVRRIVERDLGFPLDSLPEAGVDVRTSPARRDEPGRRLLIQRVAGRQEALATALPRLVDVVTPTIGRLSVWELFSPLGVAELSRVLESEESSQPELGFDYALDDKRSLKPPPTAHEPIPLRKADIPTEQLDLRMGERRKPTPDDFVWGFRCEHNGKRAATAVIIWDEHGDSANIGVSVEEACRGRGYGLAVVHAAARFILREQGVAFYGAHVSNVPSLRLARRLGFKLISQQICA